jgi:VIT1/CCC1 family predicted Fe2+/Mn2+ transporter
MSGLSSRNIERLIGAAKEIYDHKLEKIFGLKTLADAVDDESIKSILNQVHYEEEIFAEYWANRITELGGLIEKRTYFEEMKPKILLRILGTKGFFEWVLEEEEESIKEVALEAQLIQDNVQSEIWSRHASDEIRHLERIRNQVLGMDSWTFHGTSGARSVSTIYSNLYGGLLSMLAFLTGLFGARLNLSSILIMGIATLSAGSVSSFGGSYQAQQAEMEVLIREGKRKRLSDKDIDDDYKQLLEFYYSEGYSEEEANELIKSIQDKRPSSIEETIDKLGLSPVEFGSPMSNATTSAVSFAIASSIPLLPFVLSTIGLQNSLLISFCLTLICLFFIGAAKAIFSRKRLIRSGLEVMVFGALASSITYVIGTIVSILTSS